MNRSKDVWALNVASESPDVYRAEYLAYKMYEQLVSSTDDLDAMKNAGIDEVASRVQTFMGPRYDEGYVKGVHDQDAAQILKAIVDIRSTVGLLRYSTQARALAGIFWRLTEYLQSRKLLAAKLAAIGHANKLFGQSEMQTDYIEETKSHLEQFVETTQLFPMDLLDEGAEYLFHVLAGSGRFAIDKSAVDLKDAFESHLLQKKFSDKFAKSSEALLEKPFANYRVLRDWLCSYLLQSGGKAKVEYADEIAMLLLPGNSNQIEIVEHSIECELTDMLGSHGRISQGRYLLNFCHFMSRLARHDQDIVPRFREYWKSRNTLVADYSEQLHLDEFQPRVLTTFVRNKLIDQTYLPLIGDNLAKQIGAEGEGKRTDRQGLLLLISPPGYGKTTLMEYIADRLGLTFVKINGPALGNRVVSLDPDEAPNAASREELFKLNLSFEMGDNIMIYVDDIQHTNPEYLQKFISLCDAQRRVEGVYKGRSRTYDFRGKRVCVVMAGNPYTESGEKFRIPDMLANRADVYNIGDIVGDNYDQFVASYVENCLTSNPVLEKLARRSQKDVYTIMRVAETGQQEGIEFEGDYSVEELKEYISTMQKLFTVRQVILKVNQQYIQSASQANEYRTEPAFLLQGSYRNMNRIAAKVLPIMNDEELWTLIHSTYEQDAQTLTTGAESNLLKFRELTERLTEEQASRWEQIKKTFGRNLLLGGESEDKVGKVIRQLNAFSAGLDSIKDAISDGVNTVAQKQQPTVDTSHSDEIKVVGQQVLDKMNLLIEQIKQQGELKTTETKKQLALKTNKDTHTLISVLEEQFKAMETWLLPMAHGEPKGKDKVIGQLKQRFEAMVKGYNKLIDVLNSRSATEEQKQPKTKAKISKPKPKK